LDQERFALAHELGHHALNHGSIVCYDTGLVGDSAPLDEMDVGIDFESEANRFAGTLLIPRDACREDMERGAKYPDIAQKYVVSLTATAIAIDQYEFRFAKRRH
jgi:Zn-dependent peptidase ImmA (M78 family)